MTKQWDEIDKMYHATLMMPWYGTWPVFKSRYSLWAKAHALQWYANELYRIRC